jgi:hypothetical protein
MSIARHDFAKSKMKRIIHHLRNKPEKVRRDILHIATVAGAIIMIILWSYSLGLSFKNPDTQVKIKNDLQPFSVLKDNIVGGYNSISTPADNASSTDSLHPFDNNTLR